MSKHKSVFIRIDDLINRIDNDSDDFTLEDAIGIDEGDPMPSNADWVYVSWSNYVTTPRFTSDATYSVIGGREEAEQYDPSCPFYEES